MIILLMFVPSEQRLDDVTYWKDELERKLKDTKDEIEMLLAYKTRLQNALEACREPLEIVNRCLNYRYENNSSSFFSLVIIDYLVDSH